MRVALYARVSTQEQAEHGLSIDAQVNALDAWAKDHIIVDHYIDRGVSARSPASKRPELQRMLRDCEAGKIDLIVFTKLDRFFRNIKEYYKVEDVLEKSHVSWRAIHEDYETQTASGRLKTNIMLAVSQDEADRTSERIKAVFADKKKKGLVPTGMTALGLQIIDGHYAPDEDAPKVRELFSTYIAKRSLYETTRDFGLTANGVRYMIQNRHYVDAGVIDEQTFQTANAILSQRSQRHVRTDRVYLFSGLLLCPLCGGRMTSCSAGGKKYYRCYRNANHRCELKKNISEEKLEAYLLTHLLKEVGKINVEIKAKQKKGADPKKIQAKMDKLTDLYLDDRIDKEKYDREFKAAQAALVEAEREPQPIDTSEVKTVLDAYKGLSDEGKKAFWSFVIKSIVPTENGFDVVLNYTYRIKSPEFLRYVQMR